MGRLSIEISEKQHQQIKAMAVIQGLTLKEYILQRTLPQAKGKHQMTEAEALKKLEALLAPRIAATEGGKVSKRSVSDILKNARRKRKG